METQTIEQFQQARKRGRPRKSNGTPDEMTPAAEIVESIAEMCRRCNHAPVQHVEGPCQVLECDCECFVYPTDPEGNGRLLDDNPERSAAERAIYPFMQAFDEAKNERVRLSALETETRKALGAAMKAHSLTKIEIGGLEAEILSKGEKIVIHATGEGKTGTLEIDDDEETDATE